MAKKKFSLPHVVRLGLPKQVRKAIAKGASLEEQDAEGNTALCIAVEEGFVEIIRILLRHGASVTATNLTGKSALHLAAMKDFTSIAQELLNRGASPWARDMSGDTPLDLATKRRNLEVVQLLVRVMNNSELSDVHSLSAERASSSDAFDSNETSHHISVIDGLPQRKITLVRKSIIASYSLEKKYYEGNTPLCLAAEEGSYETVCNLLRNGVSPKEQNSTRKTALHLAAMNGFTSIAQELLDHGASPFARDTSGDTPLDLAMQRSHQKVVQLLVRVFKNYGLRVMYPWAAGLSNPSVASKSNKISRYSTTVRKMTHVSKPVVPGSSLEEGDFEGKLVRVITNPDVSDVYSWSAELNSPSGAPNSNVTFRHSSVIQAVHQRKTTLVKKAVVAGCSLEEEDSEGNTALCVAAKMGLDPIVSLLLDHGVSVHATNHDGKTALHLAAVGGFRSIVEKLLMKGASPYLRDANGATPMDLALFRKHKNAVKLFEKHVNKNEALNVISTCENYGCGFTNLYRFAVNENDSSTVPKFCKAPIVDQNIYSWSANILKQIRLIFEAQHRATKRRFTHLQERRNYRAVKTVQLLLEEVRESKRKHRGLRRQRESARKRFRLGAPTRRPQLVQRLMDRAVRRAIRSGGRRAAHAAAERAAQSVSYYLVTLQRKHRAQQARRAKRRKTAGKAASARARKTKRHGRKPCTGRIPSQNPTASTEKASNSKNSEAKSRSANGHSKRFYPKSFSVQCSVHQPAAEPELKRTYPSHAEIRAKCNCSSAWRNNFPTVAHLFPSSGPRKLSVKEVMIPTVNSKKKTAKSKKQTAKPQKETAKSEKKAANSKAANHVPQKTTSVQAHSLNRNVVEVMMEDLLKAAIQRKNLKANKISQKKKKISPQ